MSGDGICEQRGRGIPNIRLFWGSRDLEFASMHEYSGGDNVGDHIVVVFKGGAPITVHSKVLHKKRPDSQLSFSCDLSDTDVNFTLAL